MSKKQKVSNWGNFPTVEAEVTALEFLTDIQQFVVQKDSIIARGNGRCYGDAALNDIVFSTLKLDKIIAFDELTGQISCQAGVLLSDIIDLVLPRGWFLPVTPGTKFITVGGAIAADVHGKNHHVEGCFSAHISQMKVLIETGEVLTCSPFQQAEFFWDTVGNMGLTGIILEASFQLKKVETAYIRQEAIKAKNLEEVMALFEASKDWTYSVAWIDCLQKGKKAGRSIIMRGEHAMLEELPEKRQHNPLKIPKKPKLNIPFFLSNFTLNSLTVKAFNFLYYNKQFQKEKRTIIDYDTFFYPLDSLHNWNRIYGKKGFVQYQFVFPLATSKTGLHQVLEVIRESGQGSFLTVLKLFGQGNEQAPHSFPMQGYTLALDFKITPKLPALVHQLDRIVQEQGGRIYRAKDALSTPELFKVKPSNTKFNSLQINRLAQ